MPCAACHLPACTAGAYYLNLLWNYYRTPGIYRPEVLISETMVYDAAITMVRLWVSEQHHNASSPYRFTELRDGGLGTPVSYTGVHSLLGSTA